MRNFYFRALFIIGWIGAGLYAQAPGGVEGVEAWFVVERVSGSSFQWKDQTQNQQQVFASNHHVYTQNRVLNFNYNPALYIDTGQKYFELKHSLLPSSTIIGVFVSDNNFSSESHLYSVDGRAKEGFAMGSDQIYRSISSKWNPLDYGAKEGRDLLFNEDAEGGTLDDFKETNLRILTHYNLQPQTHSIWGAAGKAKIYLGSYYYNTYHQQSTIDLQGNSLSLFYGYIPEFIVYGRVLTPFERRKVETYLALKYGKTLDLSYIASDGNLIWNLEESGVYKHRITGLIRDDASGLTQYLSTTSDEEKAGTSGYFAYQTDSYADLYTYDNSEDKVHQAPPSAYRLLSIGLEPAGTLVDNQYMVWADNDKTLALRESEHFLSLKRTNRQWRMRTNITPHTAVETTLAFASNFLEFSDGPWEPSIYKKSNGSDSPSPKAGTAISEKPLLAEDGFVAWQNEQYGNSYTIAFGQKKTDTELEETASYGIQIVSGYAYFLEDGKRSKYITSVGPKDYLSLHKKGQQLYFKKNGLSPNHYKIGIPDKDKDKAYYLGLRVADSNDSEFKLSKFRHGGFVPYNGTRVFLSSLQLKNDPQFDSSLHPDRTYFLLVDRSGSGNFKAEETTKIPHSRTEGNKIVFHHVFWDTDGSGEDVFSFGYSDATLAATNTSSPPTCLEDIQPIESIDQCSENGMEVERFESKHPQRERVKKTGYVQEVDTYLPSSWYTFNFGSTGFGKNDAAILVSFDNNQLKGVELEIEVRKNWDASTYAGTIEALFEILDENQNPLVSTTWNSKSNVADKDQAKSIRLKTLVKGNFWLRVSDVATKASNIWGDDWSITRLVLNELPCTINTNADGEITLNMEKGSGAYSYVLSGPRNRTGTFEGETLLLKDLYAGSYTIEITDLQEPYKNQTITGTVEIESPICESEEPEEPEEPDPEDPELYELRISPVPIVRGENLVMNIAIPKISSVSIALYDMNGVLLCTHTSPAQSKKHAIFFKMPANITTGTYVVRVITIYGEQSKLIIVK